MALKVEMFDSQRVNSLFSSSSQQIRILNAENPGIQGLHRCLIPSHRVSVPGFSWRVDTWQYHKIATLGLDAKNMVLNILGNSIVDCQVLPYVHRNQEILDLKGKFGTLNAMKTRIKLIIPICPHEEMLWFLPEKLWMRTGNGKSTFLKRTYGWSFIFINE